jgi:hypothetical protein
MNFFLRPPAHLLEQTLPVAIPTRGQQRARTGAPQAVFEWRQCAQNALFFRIFARCRRRRHTRPQTGAGTNIAGVKYLTEANHHFSRVLMKRELTRCPLRFATAEAYDRPLKRVRKFVVDRSVAEYSLDDEPIGAVDREQAVGERRLSDSAAARPRAVQLQGLEGICVNPLREEPHPAIIAAVRRFGVVGLVACALGAALMRRWRSLR